MCSIAGAYSKKNQDVSSLVIDMLFNLKHRGHDAFGIKTLNEESKSKNLNELKVKKSTVCIAHSLLSITGYCVQPITRKNVSIAYNGQIYNYKKLNPLKEEPESDSVVVADFFNKELEKKSFSSVVKSFMKKAKGEYVVSAIHKKKVYVFRDFIGLKPLWFGENDSFFAFASEPSVLMKFNVYPNPLLPGHLIEISEKGLKVKKIFDVMDFRKQVPKKHSLKKMKLALEKTIELQTRGIKKAGVLFSGGVDSSLIAKMVSEKVKDTKLFVCGLKGSQDVETAKKAAKEMNLPLESIIIDEEKIKKLILRVIKILSFYDDMQIGISVPELACSDEIAKQGYKVVFSGQGSDEVFCGYANYLKVLKEKGYSSVENEKWFSISRMWSRNFYRDEIIFARNSLELRVPLVASEFLKEAMVIPSKKNILSENDLIRKHPIRELALSYGVPKEFALKPKKALQYGSGSQKIVTKLLLK